MALSEYSFNLEFISGVTNEEADSISRLCRNNMKDAPREFFSANIMPMCMSMSAGLCMFTRWVEFYHTLDATALSAAQCFLKHFGRLGAPLMSFHMSGHTVRSFDFWISMAFRRPS
jgi:hypothetical protein